MAIGNLAMKCVHRGVTYSGIDGVVWLLCNGSSYARSSYPNLSVFWPSGAYGSTSTHIHLPNLTDIYLRGYSPTNGFDPAVETRTALSGILPVGSGCGAFQTASMASHVHQDSQNYDPGGAGSSVPTQSYSEVVLSGVTSSGTVASGYDGVQSRVQISGTVVEATDVSSTRVYFYIAAT